MTISTDAFHGAEMLFRRCLALDEKDSILVILDEETIEPASVLIEVADKLGLDYTPFFVPIAVQKRALEEGKVLSLPIMEKVQSAACIITCVNARSDCTEFRRQIIHAGTGTNTRIGHMPGASLRILEAANTNYDRTVNECHTLLLALTRGKILELKSYHGNEEYTLTMDIGGWNRVAIASDGIISLGSWGNVPSGETYVAPLLNSGTGDIAINGSLPGYVLPEGEALFLRFQDGKLQFPPKGFPPALDHLVESQIRTAEQHNDTNWKNLAEIGIGVNASITELTGEMLLDEKAAGTAHIAIGANINMGGTVDSPIHCDMVTLMPTIIVDGVKILERGKLIVNEDTLRENYRIFEGHPLHHDADLSNITIHRTIINTRINPRDPRLERQLAALSGRIQHWFLGDDETAQLAARIYSQIVISGDPIPAAKLLTFTEIERNAFIDMLNIMMAYEVIHIKEKACND